jgi:hypothetical protein
MHLGAMKNSLRHLPITNSAAGALQHTHTADYGTDHTWILVKQWQQLIQSVLTKRTSLCRTALMWQSTGSRRMTTRSCMYTPRTKCQQQLTAGKLLWRPASHHQQLHVCRLCRLYQPCQMPASRTQEACVSVRDSRWCCCSCHLAAPSPS